MHAGSSRRALASIVAVAALGGCSSPSSNLCEGASPPTLEAIVVSPLALVPPFSPNVHDYYVRCAAGENSLDVSTTPSTGASVIITTPATSSKGTSASLVVNENDAIVATAKLGRERAEYWIRCLPHDFPNLTVTTNPDAGSRAPGYYLLSNALHHLGDAGYVIVLDVNGTPVWYRSTKNTQGGLNVDVLSKNTLSYVENIHYTFGTASTHSYQIHALAPWSTGYVATDGVPLDHHELRYLPNGNFLLLGWPIVGRVDLTGLESYGSNEWMVDCVVQEVTPAGKSVWNWAASDHFDVVKESTFPENELATNDAGASVSVVDPFHCNSIDVAANGNLLVSSRDLDSVFLISKATGKVIWKMGGTTYNKDGATSIQVTGDAYGGFYRQHDARFQGDHELSLFDDETAKDAPARGVVLSYDVDAGTAKVVWQYPGTTNSSAMGSMRIQPDGARVIGWGASGLVPALTEVDANGHDLFDVFLPTGDATYRAIKVPTSSLDLAILRATAGGS